MGRKFMARCKKCGEKFMVREGGGRNFYLLHCDTCGQEKEISQRELDENISLTNNKELSYDEKVENYAGKCKDGGQYKINAKARCPKCKSDEYGYAEKNGQVEIEFYD